MKKHNVYVKVKAMTAVMLAMMLVFRLALVSCEFSGSAGYGNNSGSGNTGGSGSGDTYTVTFHYGEGGGVPPNAIRVPVGFPDITLPGQGNMTHPTKAFSGWSSSGGFYGANTTYRVTKDVDFTAVWTDGTPSTPGGTTPGGTTPGGTDNSNTSIVGSWRTDNGDSTFIFNSNQTFSLSMSGNEGSGAYSVSGSVIAIIMNGETYIGSLNGNTLIFFGRSYTKINQGTNPPAATNPFLGTWNHYTDEHYLVSLVFADNNTVTQMEEGLFKGTVAYTYDGNTATIIAADGEHMIAVVSGNTLTIGDSPMIFTRQ